MDEELLRKLFPWPADRPIRRPRFGKTPPPQLEPLPAQRLAHETQGRRPPFQISYPYKLCADRQSEPQRSVGVAHF